MAGKRVKVQSAQRNEQPAPGKLTGTLEELTRLCYFYPQYTLQEARRLPYKHVAALLNQAQRQEAIKYYQLTLIANSPGSKNNKAAKDLINNYKKIIEQ